MSIYIVTFGIQVLRFKPAAFLQNAVRDGTENWRDVENPRENHGVWLIAYDETDGIDTCRKDKIVECNGQWKTREKIDGNKEWKHRNIYVVCGRIEIKKLFQQ